MRPIWNYTVLVAGAALLLGAGAPDKPVALMYGSDVLASPGTPVTFSVAVEATSSGDLPGRPLVGETVEFLLQEVGGRTLGRPEPVGTADTDAGGRASLVWTQAAPFTERPGGLELVARLAPGSEYAGMAPVRVVVPPPDHPILLVKLDAEPSPSSGAPSAAGERAGISGSGVLRELSERFQIVYLSTVEARAVPAFRAWKKRRGLPAGPILLLEDDASTPAASQELLAHQVRELVRTTPGITVGLGATAADARAFTSSGLAAVIVPPDPAAVGDLPDGALATPSWRKAYAHIRLCESSGELLRRLEGGGDGAREAQRLLDRLGMPGITCIDRLRADPELRSAAVYMGGRLRAMNGSRSAVDRSTPDALLESLMAAWRFGDPGVVGRLWADPPGSEAVPLPGFARWEAVGPPRELDGTRVARIVRLIGDDGSSRTCEVVSIRQPDSTWRILAVKPSGVKEQ